MNDHSTHMAVIGAGPVGLAVARALLQQSIPYEQLEADDDLGGIGAHPVRTQQHDLRKQQRLPAASGKFQFNLAAR